MPQQISSDIHHKKLRQIMCEGGQQPLGTSHPTPMDKPSGGPSSSLRIGITKSTENTVSNWWSAHATRQLKQQTESRGSYHDYPTRQLRQHANPRGANMG